MAFLSQLTVAALCSWFVASSLCIYPHSLSYFNESIGGPLNGPEHLLGSNADWGQDLRYLGELFRRRSELRPIYVAYSGPANPADLGLGAVASLDVTRGNKTPLLYARKSSTSKSDSFPAVDFAVSVNVLFGQQMGIWCGNSGGTFNVIPPPTAPLLLTDPIMTCTGYSIRVFDSAAVNNVRFSTSLGKHIDRESAL